MLRRKLIRTAKVYKVQFISMILLIALGIGVFVGFNAEWVTIGEDTAAFFKDCGFADYRIVDEDGISSADVDKIRDIEGVSGVSRFLSVNADVKGSDDQLALTITESEHTSGFVLTEGEDYDRWDAESFWLMDKYAELNGIKPGDKLTVTFEDLEITGTVKGLIESAEYLICVRDESQVMPDFNTYGYVYASPAMLRKVIEQQIREEEPDIDTFHEDYAQGVSGAAIVSAECSETSAKWSTLYNGIVTQGHIYLNYDATTEEYVPEYDLYLQWCYGYVPKLGYTGLATNLQTAESWSEVLVQPFELDLSTVWRYQTGQKGTPLLQGIAPSRAPRINNALKMPAQEIKPLIICKDRPAPVANNK